MPSRNVAALWCILGVVSGLGMAIAKSFVEAHHGRLWFESETGKGSAFFIQLPVKQPPAT